MHIQLLKVPAYTLKISALLHAPKNQIKMSKLTSIIRTGSSIHQVILLTVLTSTSKIIITQPKPKLKAVVDRIRASEKGI